jgi:hypothetical protein
MAAQVALPLPLLRKIVSPRSTAPHGDPVKLFYDAFDLPIAAKLRDPRLDWLVELGAEEISSAAPDSEGFLFAYQHGDDDRYRSLVLDRPRVFDRPKIRAELFYLDAVLARLAERGVDVPTPRTWRIEVDDPPPADVTFPLFVRTPKMSWKRGGNQARVRNLKELDDEIDLLRRAFAWDTPILAREWIDVAVAGKFMFGDAPQEVRTWIVDGLPVAWSFHYLHAVPEPRGFPLKTSDITRLCEMATGVGRAFEARLVVADFIRDKKGKWWFLEAGPGSAAGTAHESVFQYVARRLRGESPPSVGNAVGGSF